MIIGVAKEIKTDEYRVAMTPAGVRELSLAGHRVLIERGAGVGSSIRDEEYVANGAVIIESADDLWSESELLLKVKEPVAEEYARLGAHKHQVLFTYLHLAASRECTAALIAGNNVAIAYETVRLRDNSLPLLTPMSEVAGRMAPLVGAYHLMRPGGGHGTLIAGVPGVAPANVVVIGAGVSGLAAATVAVGLHANVKILDRILVAPSGRVACRGLQGQELFNSILQPFFQNREISKRLLETTSQTRRANGSNAG